ncbi:hypothetical protein DFJ73DRAFT_963129 [Zopfochytrium polystomum]|nr:hypothetical protein DFJ73DRAFT_963129 [Zopfochytrium polystomum]
MENRQESYDSDREYYDNEPVEAMKQKPWLTLSGTRINLEHAPKIIAALADIGRTIGNLQFKAKIKIKFQLDVEELVHFYIDVKDKDGVQIFALALAVLPICGGKDLHLTYICSTVKLERKVDLTKLCSLLLGERFRTAFVLAIDMVWLELLDCLCQNKLELHRQKLLEYCIPILVSQLNKQKGVGKLISRLAPDMNESKLIEILDAILLILPQYSLETSMDPDIHKLGFPAVIGALAQRGFSAQIQPLVQFLYNIIAHEHWVWKSFGYDVCVLILESVIRHLSPIKFTDVALLWKRSYEYPEIFTETLATASAKQMAGLINTKSASICDVERLLIAALEHAQQEYHLRSGILVMKVVCQLHQSVVGSPTVSPSITGSLLSLLAAYLNQPGEIHDPSSVPDKPEMASPELCPFPTRSNYT